jgi:hypothetical protein
MSIITKISKNYFASMSFDLMEEFKFYFSNMPLFHFDEEIQILFCKHAFLI